MTAQRRHVTGTRHFPEISCTLCTKPVDLRIEPCTDENGRAIHWDCYVKSLVSEGPKEDASEASQTMNKETSASLQETLKKIVKSAFANDPDKAQIKVVRVDHSLYREIRIDNHADK